MLHFGLLFDPIILLQDVVNGLTMGCVYALVALGFHVTWITTKTFNFGQGEFMMLGAMLAFTLLVLHPVPYVFAIVGVLVVLAPLGMVLERVAVRPTLGYVGYGWVISTIGAAYIARNGASLLWGPESKAVPSPFAAHVIRIGPVGLFPHDAFVVLASVAVAAAFFVFRRRSIYGKAMLAVAHNRDAAALMGINVIATMAASYAISAAIAGLGGVLLAPLLPATNPYMGLLPGLKAFSAGIVGGLDNAAGILLAAISLGILEQLMSTVNTDVGDVGVFVVVIAVLAVRPAGLLGKTAPVKV